MRTGFRHADSRVPFFWESADQPAARWHGPGEGPCQYLADTPEGAWAEFLRHEEITDPADLAGIARSIWAVDVPDEVVDSAVRLESVRGDDALDLETATGDVTSYARCQAFARRQRTMGAHALIAPSAALRAGGAGGELTAGGLRPAPERDGQVWALFGARPDVPGHRVVLRGAPDASLLSRVRPLSS